MHASVESAILWLYTVYVQIFVGCNFCCFHGKHAIHEIFILEISLAKVSSRVNWRAARIEAIESGGDAASASNNLGDDGKPLPNQLYSIVPWPYKYTWVTAIGEEVSELVTTRVILIRL